MLENWFDLVSHCTEHGTEQLPAAASSEDQARQAKSAEKKARLLHKCELCYKAFASEERLQVRIFDHKNCNCLNFFTSDLVF